MTIKTFRGLIADGAQDTISLHTNNGSLGYRVVKFEMMTNNPGTDTMEGTVKIYKVKQTTIDGTVDFSDNRLLGAGEYHINENTAYPMKLNVFFDQEVFNQDIYVTWKDNLTGVSINYYIELEQIKLDLSESIVATLKDIRNLS